MTLFPQRRSLFTFGIYMIGIFTVVLLANTFTSTSNQSNVTEPQSNETKPPQVSQYPNQITSAIITELQNGGHTIFIRHAKRDRIDTYRAFDRASLNTNIGVDSEFKIASCLNDQGKAEARLLGHVFSTLEIPVETVYSSPVCRALETAEIAFGRVDTIDPNLIYNGMKKLEEKTITNKNLKNLLYTPPSPSTNKVITAHRGMLEEVGWVNPQLEECGMFVIRNIDAQNAEVILAINLEDLVREALPISISLK